MEFLETIEHLECLEFLGIPSEAHVMSDDASAVSASDVPKEDSYRTLHSSLGFMEQFLLSS